MKPAQPVATVEASISPPPLTLKSKGLYVGPMTGIPTSIENMNPTNRFILGLSASPIADGVIAHSIVGVEGGGPPAEGGDGVVKYSSAHIDGVTAMLA